MMRKHLGHTERARLSSALVHAFVATVAAVFLAVGVLLGATNAAYGEEQPATLTMMTTRLEEGKVVAVPGVEATAYRIASFDAYTGEARLVDPYTSLDSTFENWDNASGMEILAPQISQIVKDHSIKGVTATSSNDGTLAFGELPHGVYFVVQSSTTSSAQDAYKFVPYIISVPRRDGGAVLYDVVCETKIAPTEEPQTPEPPDPSEPPATSVRVEHTPGGTTVVENKVTNTTSTTTTSKSASNTPGTGDMTRVAPAVLGLLAGLVLVAAGVHRRLRDERE